MTDDGQTLGGGGDFWFETNGSSKLATVHHGEYEEPSFYPGHNFRF